MQQILILHATAQSQLPCCVDLSSTDTDYDARLIYRPGARFSKNLMTNLRSTYEKV